MRNALQVHIIETKHNLVNYVNSLRLSKARHFGKPIKQFPTFYDLRHNIVIVSIFNQINDSDEIRVRFFSKDRQLILKKLHVNLLLLDLLLRHNLDSECLLSVLMHA